MKPSLSLVGYGRFGHVLERLLGDDFSVQVFDKHSAPSEIYKNQIIFYAVPIDQFAAVISSHSKYFTDRHLLIDVLSVKLHPKKVFDKYLSGLETQALLTHPMFGPDSSKNGFSGLPIVLDKYRCDSANYSFWKNYFASKGLRVVEMTASAHDQLAASSQGLTHFIGRLLDKYGLKPSPIDTLGTKKLLEITDQTCHDTWQLFTNLQHFNPYTRRMRLKLGSHFIRLYNQLLPRFVTPGVITYGIQGGVGSFNQEALSFHLRQNNVKKFRIKYLYTSSRVLQVLHQGKIDVGQFAIHNSAGGIVQESIAALAKYQVKITHQFAIKISHALMIRPDAQLADITTIMTHPQVLAQCKNNLKQKYPHLIQTSGSGKMVDHALVAKHLSQKRLPRYVAVMGSRVLADIYGLTIIAENLQDLENNFTTFLHVTRI